MSILGEDSVEIERKNWCSDTSWCSEQVSDRRVICAFVTKISKTSKVLSSKPFYLSAVFLSEFRTAAGETALETLKTLENLVNTGNIRKQWIGNIENIENIKNIGSIRNWAAFPFLLHISWHLTVFSTFDLLSSIISDDIHISVFSLVKVGKNTSWALCEQ